MHLSIKRSGGFAGLTEELGAVDTARLDDAARRRVEQLVREVGFFDLPAEAGDAVGADLLTYEITVRQGDQSHTIRFGDDGDPKTAPLRRLVEAVAGPS